MIDKAEVGELLFYRVEDELPTFRGQRRMNFAFGTGTTERFEEVEPQTFGLVCIAQARAVVVKVIPHDIEVGPRLFDVVCTDAGATEHVKDSAVFRQFARNFGEFPPQGPLWPQNGRGGLMFRIHSTNGKGVNIDAHDRMQRENI